MVYLLIGEDSEQKDARLSGLKAEYLTAPDAGVFDFEALYGEDLDPQTLQKALRALPAVSEKRLVLVRNSHRLSEDVQEVAVRFAKETAPQPAVLVLEAVPWSGEEGLIKKLRPQVKVFSQARPAQRNVFDMTRLMSKRSLADALIALDELFEDDVHPLQIMGGLVWFWGRQRSRLTPAEFEEGLQALQQADLNIKRSRLPAEQAVELAVVKLSTMLG